MNRNATLDIVCFQNLNNKPKNHYSRNDTGVLPGQLSSPRVLKLRNENLSKKRKRKPKTYGCRFRNATLPTGFIKNSGVIDASAVIAGAWKSDSNAREKNNSLIDCWTSRETNKLTPIGDIDTVLPDLLSKWFQRSILTRNFENSNSNSQKNEKKKQKHTCLIAFVARITTSLIRPRNWSPIRILYLPFVPFCLFFCSFYYFRKQQTNTKYIAYHEWIQRRNTKRHDATRVSHGRPTTDATRTYSTTY